MDMTDNIKTKKNRLESLDSLRGIAALAVVLFHYTIIVHRFVPDLESPFTFEHGHYGVELFFIISGFVIFMTITRCKTGMDFIVSRFSRLYPAFWICVSLTFILGISYPLQGQNYSFSQYLINLSMAQEYLKQPNIDGVYWSLTYELGFYFAIFCIYKLRLLGKIDYICLAWAGCAILFHFYSAYIPHPLHYLLLINKYAHLFAAGICFYQIQKSGFTPLRILTLLVGISAQFIVDGLLGGFIVIGFFLLFYLAVNERLPFLKNRILIFFGSISYPLYLLHQMIGFQLIDYISHSLNFTMMPAIMFTTIIVVLLASIVTFVFDKPTTKFIRVRYKNWQLSNIEKSAG